MPQLHITGLKIHQTSRRSLRPARSAAPAAVRRRRILSRCGSACKRAFGVLKVWRIHSSSSRRTTKLFDLIVDTADAVFRIGVIAEELSRAAAAFGFVFEFFEELGHRSWIVAGIVED